MKIKSWIVIEPAQAMVLQERDEICGDTEVIVAVAGCGLCHTDLGFFYDGVPTRHPFPLALGHEVSGTVVEAGSSARDWVGANVVVPAVIPCGQCAACRAGHASICPRQIFPGNDVHGGFGTHLKVPAKGLCRVPDLSSREHNPAGLPLAALSVIADAVSTPYQAIERAGVRAGDLAVFVGVGGVGGFGVQIAAARGAHVVAIDTNQERLTMLDDYGSGLSLDAGELGFKEIKAAIKAYAKEREVPSWRWRVFETSGTPVGQTTAFGLVGHGAYLSMVGFTAEKVTVRLSNLMAFDATVQGNWGCLPEYYPDIVELALAGKIRLPPFIERRPMSTINDAFEDVRSHRVSKRIVLEPEEH